MAQNTNHVIKLSIEPTVVGHISKGVWVVARLPARGELCASHGIKTNHNEQKNRKRYKMDNFTAGFFFYHTGNKRNLVRI